MKSSFVSALLLLPWLWVLVACPKSRTEPIPEEPLTLGQFDVRQQSVATFTVPTGTFTQDEYAGTLGGQAVKLARYGTRFYFVVPDVPTGPHPLRFEVGGKTYVATYRVRETPTLTLEKAQQTLDALRKNETEFLQKIERRAQADATFGVVVKPAALAALRQATERFGQELARASSQEKINLVRFITNYPAAFGPLRIPAGRLSATVGEEEQELDEFDRTNQKNLGELTGTAGAARAGGPLLGGFFTKKAAERTIESNQGLYQRGFEELMEIGPPRVDSRTPLETTGPTDYVSEKEYEVSFNGEHANPPALPDRVPYKERLRTAIDSAKAWTGRLREFVPDLPPVPSLGDFPVVKTIKQIASKYLTLGNVSNPKVSVVKKEVRGDKLVLTIKTNETTPQAFSIPVTVNHFDGLTSSGTIEGKLMPGPTNTSMRTRDSVRIDPSGEISYLFMRSRPSPFEENKLTFFLPRGFSLNQSFLFVPNFGFYSVGDAFRKVNDTTFTYSAHYCQGERTYELWNGASRRTKISITTTTHTFDLGYRSVVPVITINGEAAEVIPLTKPAPITDGSGTRWYYMARITFPDEEAELETNVGIPGSLCSSTSYNTECGTGGVEFFKDGKWQCFGSAQLKNGVPEGKYRVRFRKK